MKVDRYRVLLPHPYIHRILLHDIPNTYRRSYSSKKRENFIFIDFADIVCIYLYDNMIKTKISDIV